MTDVRTDVSLGCRVLAMTGQSDMIWGHVSRRDPDGRGTWLKGGGLGFEEVAEDDVLLVSREGELLEGQGRVHLEYPIHTELLARRPDLGAVVHTHGEASVTFSAMAQDLRPLGHEGALFTPPALPRFDATSDLIHTGELGAAVAETMGSQHALLLVNHGVVTAGKDVATAVLRAVLLEKACRMQLAASAAGGPAVWSTDEDALGKRERVYGETQLTNAWKYLLRQLPPLTPR